MNIYVCGAYGPRMGVYSYCHCRRHLHLRTLSITRRFLSDVQTDVHFVRVDSDSPTIMSTKPDRKLPENSSITLHLLSNIF